MIYVEVAIALACERSSEQTLKHLRHSRYSRYSRYNKTKNELGDSVGQPAGVRLAMFLSPRETLSFGNTEEFIFDLE